MPDAIKIMGVTRANILKVGGVWEACITKVFDDSYIVPVDEGFCLQNLQTGSTLVNGASLSNGDLVLDGVNDYATLPNNSDYDRGSGDLTIQCWFYLNTLPADGEKYMLVDKFTGPHDWDGWTLRVSRQAPVPDTGEGNMNGGLAVYLSSTGAGASRNRRYEANITTGTWHHAALVLTSGGDAELYYDGTELAAFSPASMPSSTSELLRMGTGLVGVSQTQPYFDGKITGVTILQEVLSPGDIEATYRGSNPT
jgi:hypothetical protein